MHPVLFYRDRGTPPYICKNRAPDCVWESKVLLLFFLKSVCMSIENSWIQPRLLAIFLIVLVKSDHSPLSASVFCMQGVNVTLMVDRFTKMEETELELELLMWREV